MELTAVQEKQYQKEIDRVFKSLMRQLRNLSRQDKRMVTKAFEFAREAHKDTRRKSGEPYILHPLAVATIIVKEMGLKDAVATACALIHDVVEDTDIELSDIKRQFGPKIMEITNGLTKIASSEVKSEFVSLQAETFRKILLTISDDVRVILIKLADRLHNMRTLGAMRQEKVLKIASETMYIYAPLAHRLGLYEIKTELEDLSFKYSDSKQYNEIAEKVQASKEEAQLYIQRFIEDVRKALRSTGLKYTVKSRYKSIYSVYQKMERKRLPFEEIYDLYAIRIILEAREGKEREDCWQVYSVLSGLYRANPKRLRDWITHPKENGYESLHTTLRGPEGQWIELQIRTTRMDEVAEKGIAAHWIYKGDNEEEAFLSEWIAQIREVLANPSLNALEAVREFKENLQPNDVIVFTPKGEMIRLPVHATVLDFAFKIHTDLGSAAIGARVNQKVEVLDHELRSGDTVEVLTSRKAKPTKEWLRYVRTPRAKDYIKHALKMQRKEVVEQGKALFNWRAAKYGVDENHPVMRELLVYFVIPNEEEFFYLLGSHKIETQKIQEFIRLKEEGK
ncbi:MAG: RelA/SpoT family protein, partial [Bacteroidota bacterium]